MKTQGPVGPALESELSTKAEWQQFYSLLKIVKKKKRSAKPLFTPLEMKRIVFLILTTM